MYSLSSNLTHNGQTRISCFECTLNESKFLLNGMNICPSLHQMAFIHTGAQTFYIEPLDDTERVNLSEKRHKRAVPHIIYKGKTREVADWECDVIDGETG